ncbi:MAG TPA: DUF6600 domain-containing protein [Myxococcaceae bacterium]
MAALGLSACVATAQTYPYGSYGYDYGEDYSGQVSLGDLQMQLAPYGQWVAAPSYGSCWRPDPSIVGYDFQPYLSNGNWEWTDAGWQFESNLPFAWATFHYGRWLNDAQMGWCWAPGTEWAPSWVSWRYGAGYVGWAPLPPAGWAYPVGWAYPWYFVGAPYFVAHDVYRYRLPPREVHRVYRVTRPAPPAAGRPYVVGPPPQHIASATGRPVPVAPPARGRPPPGAAVRPWQAGEPAPRWNRPSDQMTHAPGAQVPSAPPPTAQPPRAVPQPPVATPPPGVPSTPRPSGPPPAPPAPGGPPPHAAPPPSAPPPAAPSPPFGGGVHAAPPPAAPPPSPPAGGGVHVAPPPPAGKHPAPDGDGISAAPAPDARSHEHQKKEPPAKHDPDERKQEHHRE